MASIKSTTIGFPRIGSQRQMKTALEKYWKGNCSEADLLGTLHAVEAEAWGAQKAAGIAEIALDSTLYDQMLDTAFWLGAIPKRFQHLSGTQQYFAMARGAEGCAALDMSKFFDTNYHFLVPELELDLAVRPNLEHVLGKVARGQALLGKQAAVPCIMGPVTFACLGRGALPRDEVLLRVLPAYEQLLRELAALGVPAVQVHEPILVSSKASSLRPSFELCYQQLAASAAGVALSLVSYYDDLDEDVYCWAVQLPVAALHLDFLGVAGSTYVNRNLEWVRKHGWPAGKVLGAGVVDGRSVWADKDGAAASYLRWLLAIGIPAEQLRASSSTPLQHLPYSLVSEPEGSMTPVLRGRMSFAVQKLDEIVVAAVEAVVPPIAESMDKVLQEQFRGPTEPIGEGFNDQDFSRKEVYDVRRPKQIQMPAFPTSTIGSFPQTPAVRAARAAFRAGRTTLAEYQRAMAAQIGFAVGVQEALGLDVLVHGEAERTDMVEFFGQELEGFHFTVHGWVQSYGSRYVRPPIIKGDVSFIKPMTVAEYQIAQSLTTKPMKGMLTGPVTVLNWSFPRKDISRKAQALQLAAALRQEVAALEGAGCRVVQVDEPALREGLPLKQERHTAYLRWAVDAFRLTTAVAKPETQIVTHLCYSDFEDIMQAIEEMDADVLTIENSRSGNEMMMALSAAGYTRDIGPGVYDVHSPVVPTVEFFKEKIRSFVGTGILAGHADRLWVNPDCGLKTRGWPETMAALKNMVQAAAESRQELAAAGKLPRSTAELAPAGAGAGGRCVCRH